MLLKCKLYGFVSSYLYIYVDHSFVFLTDRVFFAVLHRAYSSALSMSNDQASQM